MVHSFFQGCFIYILDSSNSSSFTFLTSQFGSRHLALEATEPVTQMAVELINNHLILV